MAMRERYTLKPIDDVGKHFYLKPWPKKGERMAKKAAKTLTGNWIVRMYCGVTKDVYVEGCTEEQARSDPFAYSVDEQEVDQFDWEVKSVERNE